MILLLILLAAVEPQLPPGVSCDAVRRHVAEHGIFKSVLWAKAQGYSWHQIREAKKCLR